MATCFLILLGDSVARACIVPSKFLPARVNQHVAIIRANDKANNLFLLAWLQANKGILLKLASSGATRNALTKRMLENLDVNLPPIDVQNKVAAFIDSIQAKITLNTKLNGYLEEQCEAVANHEKGLAVELSSLCDLVKEKADYNEADFDTYVSTESLLPGKKGRQAPSSLPQTGKVTVYKAGDILVSNIRPYFKKIWYADRTGTCSGDVLVFRAKQPEQSGYLYSCMRSDAFFDYVMKGAKGTKMPRGDKKQMLTYKVASNPSGATVDFIESALSQASSSSKENHRLAALRDNLLPKLMSGEIDVSKVDLKQLNSHLA
ncbi:restriction endonuclease subunit S [Collinsella sp. AM33-4BH]|uniref:restriction endonuclease subunit S n=1 Tax=Collinsella sp. AM33-4BH TaxID=2292315 RepID=UPI0018F2DE97|nr:restriction endonuclease subunit S [Collinsella sp. AM33-4BH]